MRLFKIAHRDKQTIDRLMLVGGVVGPIFTLPQAYTIFSTQSAASVSLLSWALYTLLSVIGVLYSIIHRDKILLLGYILYVLADLAVVGGIVVYG